MDGGTRRQIVWTSYFVLFVFGIVRLLLLNETLSELAVDLWQLIDDFGAILSLLVQLLLYFALFELLEVEGLGDELGLLVQPYVHEVAVHVSSQHIGANEVRQSQAIQLLLGDELVIVVH